jgi:predicted component of type VI protein secretion system
MRHTAMDYLMEARTGLLIERAALRNLMRHLRDHETLRGSLESVFRDTDLNLAVLDDMKGVLESLP